MNIDILGPVTVRDSAGRQITLAAGHERSLLVLLLIYRDEVVSVDRIVDALWGEHAPETAAKAVQGYVSHLRRALDPDHELGGSEGLLLTRPPGYAFRSDDISVDAVRFERLAANGSRALEDGSLAEAATALGQALALWRGPALAEFAFHDFAQSEIHRLEELRLAATEDRAEALLRLGRHAEVVGELDSLVEENPLRERLRGQLMLALYRGGRQADALHVYRDGRRRLQGELGLEPGPELQRLEQAILAHDPALEAPAQAPLPVSVTEREGQSVAPSPSGGGPRRMRVAIVGALVVATIATLFALALIRDDAPPSIDVVPPAVVAVDPNTNRVVASITAGSRPVSVAAGEGAVWVGDGRDGTVTRIDPVNRDVVKTIGIGAPAVDLATGGGSVWVATGSFGAVVRIDSEFGAIVDGIQLGDPNDPVVPPVSSVAVGEGHVWVGAFDGLLRLDPDSGEITGRADLGESPALQITVGGGAAWATTLASRAKRVEASSLQETVEFYAGNFVFAIAFDRTGVWVGGNQGQLSKIDPVTAATLLTARIGGIPSSIALGDGAVWVALPGKGLLLRVDPDSGDVQEQIRIGGEPEDVAVGYGLVWVAVQSQSAAG